MRQEMSLATQQAGGVGKALAPLRQALAAAQASFADALPVTVRRYLTPERLTKITLAAVSRSPLLLECTPESVLRSVMDAASMGLEPGGPLGHAYLVPYKNNKTGKRECQLITGYRGLIVLARRSGEIESVSSHVVHARDEFRADLATGELSHKPFMAALPDDAARMSEAEIDAACDRGPPVAVYCVATFKGGGRHVDLMTMADVERIKRRSKASEAGPWQTDYLEMSRKTVTRRAAKYWPMSLELSDALGREDDTERAYEVAAQTSRPMSLAARAATSSAIEPPAAPGEEAHTQAQQAQAAPALPEPAGEYDFGPPPWGEEEPAPAKKSEPQQKKMDLRKAREPGSDG